MMVTMELSYNVTSSVFHVHMDSYEKMYLVRYFTLCIKFMTTTISCTMLGSVSTTSYASPFDGKLLLQLLKPW